MSLEPLASPRVVERAFAARRLRSERESSIELFRAWPIWNGGLSALYRAPGTDLASTWAVVTDHPGLPEKIRRSLAASEAVYVPELQSFAFRPQQDPRLPGIALAELSRDLQASLVDHLPGIALERVVLRSYKPLYRAMFECRWGESPTEAIFVKIQSRYGFRSTRRVYEEIARGSTDLAEVARPIGHLNEHRASIWAGRPGRSLRTCLAAGDDRQLDAAARLLARLHRSDLDPERHHDRNREIETVARWTAVAAAAFPAIASELDELRAELEGAALGLPSPRYAPAHRDFHEEQILVDGDRTTLLDLDTLARAEPELDAGNFLAHLELPANGHPTKTAEAFLEAYLATSDRLDGSVLAWHRAGALLRLACVYAFRPGRERRLPHLLERTATALDRLRPLQEVMA